VLIFGAGYDTNKDGTGVATADSMGRGIFIVDAETGVLIWSVTPAANSTTNLQEAGLAHSVAASVATLDSNGDELADRIYFGDTGGNLWRVDMPGNALPTSSQDTWRIVQMADMNGSSAATDRRFFNAPDIVRTKDGDLAFDAVLIGTGDRTNPNATDVSNQFYMIRDQRLLPYFTPEPTTAECTSTTDPINDFRCGLPLSPSNLYDVTPNLIQVGNTTQQQAAAAALAAAAGWRLDLSEGTGEKNLAKSLTIAGTVYFTTFAPDTSTTIQCEPIPGFGRLYAVSLLNAAEVVDFDNDNDKERSWVIGNLIPDTPSVHFGSDGEIRLLLPPGSDIANPFLTGATVPDPYSSYWYREEY
jgi:type IV pilus assembly protein PilY1